MNEIAIMQGRLLPPYEGRFQAFPAKQWRDEFVSANKAGLGCIEWIFEKPNEHLNPLGSEEGIKELHQIIKTSSVGIRSICADYYMEEFLIDSDGNERKKAVDHLHWLIDQAAKLSVIYIVLPFVDVSSLITSAQQQGLISLMQALAPKAAKVGLELHLETDLNPTIFSGVLKAINHPSIQANFDIGNSASLGYDPTEELIALAPFLGSVHVKDRILGGSTVAFGQGNADFRTCFNLIRKAGFSRHFVLQAARDKDGHEIDLAIHNRKFVERQLSN
jgi:L-ribulose-5-phosphate 3-epimerase